MPQRNFTAGTARQRARTAATAHQTQEDADLQAKIDKSDHKVDDHYGNIDLELEDFIKKSRDSSVSLEEQLENAKHAKRVLEAIHDFVVNAVRDGAAPTVPSPSVTPTLATPVIAPAPAPAKKASAPRLAPTSSATAALPAPAPAPQPSGFAGKAKAWAKQYATDAFKPPSRRTS